MTPWLHQCLLSCHSVRLQAHDREFWVSAEDAGESLAYVVPVWRCMSCIPQSGKIRTRSKRKHKQRAQQNTRPGYTNQTENTDVKEADEPWCPDLGDEVFHDGQIYDVVSCSYKEEMEFELPICRKIYLCVLQFCDI